MTAATLARPLIAVAALLVLWRIIVVNAVLYDVDGRPSAGATPTALAAVIRENPAEVGALLAAARGRERAGDFGGAKRAYAVAYELAPLEREVLATRSAFLLARGETGDALAMLDRLAEHFPESRARAFPVLAALLASHPAQFGAMAARDPDWVGAFILDACASRADPARMVPVLLRRVAARKATTLEIACVIDRLRAAERWDEAYQVWLNTLPRERLANVGFVYNGGFELAPSGLGFDWMPSRSLERDSGHSVEMARHPGVIGERALRVAYNGKRQSGVPIAQYLALAPGRYELSGIAKADGMRVGRGVRWAVRCVAQGKPQDALATSPRVTGSGDWERFAFEVVVPPSCRGQLLQLEPVADEGTIYVAGVAWFDNLVLRRLG